VNNFRRNDASSRGLNPRRHINEKKPPRSRPDENAAATTMPKTQPDEVENQVDNPVRTGFVKMTRSPDILELIETWPLAFALAAVIALRARYRPGVSLKGLQPGEALLGDFTRYGMTEQQYRTCKKQLTKWNFATFKPTPKGTVAKLMDTRLFDVLNVAANGQNNRQPTDGQRLTKKERTEEDRTMTG
jgi:hypothetical protein